MYRQQFYIIINLLMLADAIICIAAGYSAYSLSLEIDSGGLIMNWNDVLLCILLTMFMNNFLMAKFGFYSEKRFRSYPVMMTTLCMAVLLDILILSFAAILININPFSRLFVTTYFLFLFIPVFIIRMSLYYYLDNRILTVSNSRQILIVGDNNRLVPIIKALQVQPSWGHRIAGYINIDDWSLAGHLGLSDLGRLDDFEEIIHKMQIDEVIFAVPGNHPIDLKKYLNKCEEIGMAFRIVPGLYNIQRPNLRVELIQNIPTLALYSGAASPSGLFYKKILDILLGVIGFILLVIMFPIIGIAIKMDSPGSVLFRQERVGMNNRRFMLYKFRTMVQDAEKAKKDLLSKSEMNGPIFKMEKDPRITKVGKILRKTSLDEVPQFINVLKGEMSIVGTRPPTPDEVASYEDWHRRRISMKPGLTGLWQVSGRNKITDFDKIVELDLKYIDGWRFWHDILIIFKTIWVVLLRKGAK